MTKNNEENDFERSIQTAIYMFKVNNRNIRTNCEICSKSRAKTPDRLNSDFAEMLVKNVLNNLIIKYILFLKT